MTIWSGVTVMLFTAALLGLLVRNPRAIFPVLSKSGPDCQPTSLLNLSEQRLYATLTSLLHLHAPHLAVAPQVAYGAFLRTKDRSRWREIAYKRADFVVFSADGRVHAVVEFDGAGHLGDSFSDARRAIRSDQAKNGACASAGVPVIRVMQRYSQEDVATALGSALQVPMSGPLRSPEQAAPGRPRASRRTT